MLDKFLKNLQNIVFVFYILPESQFSGNRGDVITNVIIFHKRNTTKHPVNKLHVTLVSIPNDSRP